LHLQDVLTKLHGSDLPAYMVLIISQGTGRNPDQPIFSRLYGPESRKPGTYAANCLLARRLAERGVRFIQLFHRCWRDR
jgi:hypothetical protein